MQAHDYDGEFDQALLDTARLGLRIPPRAKQVGRLLDNARSLEKLTNILNKHLGVMRPEDAAGQCFALNHKIKSEIDHAFQTTSVLTLGWLRVPPSEYFRTPMEELALLAAGTKAARSINLHCWLTLPTNEIIDATFSTTLGVVRKNPDLYGCTIATHWRELKRGFEFHPQIIGDDFLYKTAMLAVVSH